MNITELEAIANKAISDPSFDHENPVARLIMGTIERLKEMGEALRVASYDMDSPMTPATRKQIVSAYMKYEEWVRHEVRNQTN